MKRWNALRLRAQSEWGSKLHVIDSNLDVCDGLTFRCDTLSLVLGHELVHDGLFEVAKLGWGHGDVVGEGLRHLAPV